MDFAARPKFPVLAAAARYLRSSISIKGALLVPLVQPRAARCKQNVWLEAIANSEPAKREGARPHPANSHRAVVQLLLRR
jgi:hypothetical protein